MKRKNTARNALITSILSLLLCVSMLVGATFAWFTDEVTTGMNTIAAGNLDIELLADGAKVDSTTALFDDVELWEPGVVVYENLQVANVGNLALKYQMTLNFGNENDLNGHKLSEVLKVAVIDKVADGATREEVLALAQAAIADDQGKGALSNFYLTGALAPKGKTETINNVEYTDKSEEMTVVVFWAPNDNATDNLYNANNGQKTSDEQPLHIQFGINLQATQLMYEDDSFGNDYDENASILPKASVNGLPAQTISTTWGMGGGAAEEIEVPFILQFQPNEQLTDPDGTPDSGDEYLASEYAKWHADFVVSADHDVPANSMALGGYYVAFCKDYNGDNWVSLTSSDDITAGTQIRLVDGMGSGAITVNYEEICRYGNDGIGFLCTAKDLTGVNDGTTITVELRLYETLPYGHEEHDLGDGNICHGNTANCETGYYEVVGTYTYTFVNTVSTADELKEQLAAGNDVTLAADIALDKNDTITIPTGKDVTIDLAGHKLSASADKTGNQEAFLVKGNLTVKNGSMEMTALNNQGWGAMATIFDVTAGGVLNLDGVTAQTSGTDMAFVVHMNNWGEVTLNAKDCTLVSNYVAVRAFNSGPDMNNVTIENSTLKGGSVALWVHNYTAADLGGKVYSNASEAYDQAKVDARLNFNLTGNTLVGSPAKAGPVRLGMTDSIYGDVTILP